MNFIQFNQQTICPSKIVCIGRNYVAHIEELGNTIPSQQVIFIKPNSAISNTIRTHPEDCIHFEAEIAFLILQGRIKGVGFGLDLTKRVLQNKLKSQGLPWERAKAFDHSAVFSEFIPFTGDMSELRLELSINDILAQAGGYEQMLFKPEEILTEVQSFLSLEDGDIIMSGTPEGVAEIIPGDKFSGRIYAAEKLLLEAYWVVK